MSEPQNLSHAATECVREPTGIEIDTWISAINRYENKDSESINLFFNGLSGQSHRIEVPFNPGLQIGDKVTIQILRRNANPCPSPLARTL